MTTTKLEAMTTEQLVTRFVELGEAQDQADLYDEITTFNRLFDEKTLLLEELKARPGDLRRALLPLYDHTNIQVRLNAVIATLAIAPQAARQELEAIAKRMDVPQGGDAGMMLRGLNDGTFKPT